MRFSEFIAYHALQENNRCLHLLSLYPTPLSDTGVHSLRIGVKRLRASWRLLRGAVPDQQAEAADARLQAIHHSLAAARDSRVLAGVARDLIGKSPKQETQAALQRIVDELAGPGRARPLSRAAVELISDGFQRESRFWRELDVDHVADATVIAGYVNTYRHGRRIGRRVLHHEDTAQLHHWRRWVKSTFYQLDMVRPVLGGKNRARRWYLDRLGDGLGKHHDLLLFSSRLDELGCSEADRVRIDEVLETRLQLCLDRARKLYPYCYDVKGRAFGHCVADDLARLSFDNVVVVPRSA